MNQLCKVCGEPAAGFHFGAFTCEGCKSFFGRTYNNVSGVSECKNGGRCEINKKNRTSCKSCRLRKCLQVGMSKSGSRYGRRSNWFKIHCLLSSQGQNGGMNSLPETNNNNSTVTNNNPNANSNSSGVNHHGHHGHHPHKHHLPSTVTSHGHAHGHGQAESEPDSDRPHHRQRSSSSGNSHLNNSQGPPPPFLSNLSAMSPESKEQFLASLNRKMMSPDLFEYFRSANLSLPNGNLGNPGLPKPFLPFGVPDSDDRGEDMSRASPSPGSLESPNSEASGDEPKPSRHLPLFGLPPGSPLDVKPNDILSFDLLTRDLMKLGYDPVRFWPAMLGAPPSSLHQFNPYRFMFPNFPGGPGVPPGFPPSPILGNGFLGAPLLPNGSALLPNTNKMMVGPSTESPVPPHVNRRFPLIVPPASSLTLTPPISHHGSDEPSNLSTSRKPRKFSSDDQPIDLSAKAITNNNNEVGPFRKVKSEPLDHDPHSDSDSSDFDDEDEGRVQGSCSDSSKSSGYRRALGDNKEFLKGPSLRDLRDSGREEEQCDGDDESEPFGVNHRIHRKRRDRRPSSNKSPSPLPKKLKVSAPLDLTRTTSSNPPPAKVAT